MSAAKVCVARDAVKRRLLRTTLPRPKSIAAGRSRRNREFSVGKVVDTLLTPT
jgi:hypothetical protein